MRARSVRYLDRCSSSLDGDAGALGVDRAQTTARPLEKRQFAALGETQKRAGAARGVKVPSVDNLAAFDPVGEAFCPRRPHPAARENPPQGAGGHPGPIPTADSLSNTLALFLSHFVQLHLVRMLEEQLVAAVSAVVGPQVAAMRECVNQEIAFRTLVPSFISVSRRGLQHITLPTDSSQSSLDVSGITPVSAHATSSPPASNTCNTIEPY